MGFEWKKLIIIATKLNVTKCVFVARTHSFFNHLCWNMAWSRATRLLDNCVISMHNREYCSQQFRSWLFDEAERVSTNEIKCIKKMIFILTAGMNDSENEGMNIEHWILNNEQQTEEMKTFEKSHSHTNRSTCISRRVNECTSDWKTLAAAIK